MKSNRNAKTIKKEFKRVPALDKGVRILELLAQSKNPLGLTEIAKALGYHAGTVYNIVYTLVDQSLLENIGDKKFRLGLKLYKLGKAALGDTALISSLHPYLEEINAKTRLSVFLGFRSGLHSLIVDSVESNYNVRISSEVGRRFPLHGGAGGKALLSQLSDAEVDSILSENKLERFTPKTVVSKKKYKEIIGKVRQEGIAISDEEYVEGVGAIAVPLQIKGSGFPIAIWVLGLKTQIKEKGFTFYTELLKEIAKKIEDSFSIL